MLIPHDKTKNGVVIEVKRINKQKDGETTEEFHNCINVELEKALSQINRNKYYNELIINNIQENNIIKLPIVFAGKEPFVNTITGQN